MSIPDGQYEDPASDRCPTCRSITLQVICGRDKSVEWCGKCGSLIDDGVLSRPQDLAGLVLRALRAVDTMTETLTIAQTRCTELHNEKAASAAAERLRIRTTLMALVTEADDAADPHVAIWTEEVLRRIAPTGETI